MRPRPRGAQAPSDLGNCDARNAGLHLSTTVRGGHRDLWHDPMPSKSGVRHSQHCRRQATGEGHRKCGRTSSRFPPEPTAIRDAKTPHRFRRPLRPAKPRNGPTALWPESYRAHPGWSDSHYAGASRPASFPTGSHLRHTPGSINQNRTLHPTEDGQDKNNRRTPDRPHHTSPQSRGKHPQYAAALQAMRG